MIKSFLAGLAVLGTLSVAAPAAADSFDSAVESQIRAYLSYPETAVLAQQEGTVGVHITFGTDGRVTKIALDHPSGEHALDLATLRALRRLARDMEIPTADQREIHLTVSYRLT